jgi:hypothetical protein
MSASNENDPPNLTVIHVPPTSDATTDLIDEPALAARLGVSRSTLQSWRYSGRGPRFMNRRRRRVLAGQHARTGRLIGVSPRT